jgi:hypothetical protein
MGKVFEEKGHEASLMAASCYPSQLMIYFPLLGLQPRIPLGVAHPHGREARTGAFMVATTTHRQTPLITFRP